MSKNDYRQPLISNEISIQIPETGRLKMSKTELVNIMSDYQNRKVAEEIERLEAVGGLKGIEIGLSTNLEKGIKSSEQELQMRENKYGHNRKPEVESRSFLELLWEALQDYTLKILIVAAFTSIILSVATAEPKDRGHAWVEGFAILVAVMVCSMVAAVNDYQKEKQFQQLNKVADDKKKYSVYRDGQSIELHSGDLLVGDLIVVREGMNIPADGVLVKAAEVVTDESAMTGETEPVRKEQLATCQEKLEEHRAGGHQSYIGTHDIPSPVLMSGSKILTGEGLYLVLVVGDSSCEGKIRAILSEGEVEATPLQKKLENLADDIGKFGFISAIIIVGALLVRFSIERYLAGSFEKKHLVEILNFFIIGVTVVVVAIPEGLPLSVTLSLAFSVKRMLKDNNLVRKLQACETMGGANMICSDKTGTLTQNKMTLTSIWNQSTLMLENYQQSFDLRSIIQNKDMQEVFKQMTVYNQSAQLQPVKKGNSTELAVLEFLEKCQVDIDYVLQQHPVVKRMPFNSRRKRMGVMVELGGNKTRLLMKGASEILLENCSHFQTFGGDRMEIDAQLRNQINNSIEEMAANALRTLCYAYKDLESGKDYSQKDSNGVFEVEKSGLTLVSVFGIKDILRKEVPAAIQQCKMAGIKVRMVTGDNRLTAKAIAHECGIIDKYDPNSLVMEGAEFIRRIGGVICKQCQVAECSCNNQQDKNKKRKRVDTIANAYEFDLIYPNLCVLARSRPEDKYALVVGLQERGHVVAVTGDGTNDAPALKKADVGFAMGIAGTEVARESAEIILLDDNFKSIVKAVLWGRNIYDNIKKFLQFQLTVNLVAVLSTLVGAVLLKQEIMSPIQMLWINLIMDSLASLALATESPSQELLVRQPHKKDEYMVNQNMFKHIIGQSLYQMAVVLFICFYGEHFVPEVQDDLDTHIHQQLAANNLHYFNLHGLLMKYHSPALSHVRSGRLKTMSDNTNYYPAYHNKYQGLDYQPILVQVGPSRHFTFLFNTFVWMTIFNFLNARLLNDKINIFKGIFNNPLFTIIVGFIAIIQVLLTTFGGLPFGCYYWGPFYGLHSSQWLWCMLFSIGGMIWSVVLKMIPDNLIFGGVQVGQKEQDPSRRKSSILGIKRQHSKVMSQSKNYSMNK